MQANYIFRLDGGGLSVNTNPDDAVCQRFWLGNILNAILCVRRALIEANYESPEECGGTTSPACLCVCVSALDAYLENTRSIFLVGEMPVPHCKRICPEMISTPSGLKCVHVATCNLLLIRVAAVHVARVTSSVAALLLSCRGVAFAASLHRRLATGEHRTDNGQWTRDSGVVLCL